MDLDQPFDFPADGDMGFGGLEVLNDMDRRSISGGPTKTPDSRKRVCSMPFFEGID